MNFAQDTNEESTTIRSYSEEFLVVGESRVDTHCQLHKSGLIEAWQPANPASLTIDDLQILIDFRPELILLGTGKRLQFPSTDVRRFFNQAGIGLEVMDTGAACRTYNILLNEGRDVGAAILLDIEY